MDTRATLPDTLDKNEPTNGGIDAIETEVPYRVDVEITGTCDLLLHRWNSEAVDEKAKAAKNSKAKKEDNIESYVYRDEDGMICLPGEYLRQSVCMSAKFRQDPRSPRKSAMELYKAGVQSLTMLASLGTSKWHYEDRRRAVVQRNGINRTRPAMRAGWKARFQFIVLTPQYITPSDLHQVMSQAGLLVGVGDFRPTFGRFHITSWELLADATQAPPEPPTVHRPPKVLMDSGKQKPPKKADPNGEHHKGAVPGKREIVFRDNEGHEWSGWARVPKWILEHEALGGSREDFRVQP